MSISVKKVSVLRMASHDLAFLYTDLPPIYNDEVVIVSLKFKSGEAINYCKQNFPAAEVVEHEGL